MHCTLSSLNQFLHLTSTCLIDKASSTVIPLSSSCSNCTLNDNVNEYDNLFSRAHASLSYLESSHKLHKILLELMHNRRLRNLQQEYQYKNLVESGKERNVNKEVRNQENIKNSTSENQDLGDNKTEKNISYNNIIKEAKEYLQPSSSQKAEIICENINDCCSQREEIVTTSSTSDESILEEENVQEEQEQREKCDKNSLSFAEKMKETLQPIKKEFSHEINLTYERKNEKYKHDLLIQLLLRYRAKRSQNEEQSGNNSSSSDNAINVSWDNTKPLLRNVHIMKESEKSKASRDMKTFKCENQSIKENSDKERYLDDAQVHEWDEVYKMFLETVTLTSKYNNNGTSNDVMKIDDNNNEKDECTKSAICPTIYHINTLLEYALLVYHIKGFDDAFDFYDRFACAVNELLEEKMNRLMTLESCIATNIGGVNAATIEGINTETKYSHEHSHHWEKQASNLPNMDGKLNEYTSNKSANTLPHSWSWIKPWTNDTLMQSVNKPFSHLLSLATFVARAENSKRLLTLIEESEYHLPNNEEELQKLAISSDESCTKTMQEEQQEEQIVMQGVENERAITQLYSEILELNKLNELMQPNKHTFLLLMQRHYLTGNWMQVIRYFHTAEQMNSVVDEEMLDMLFSAYLQITPDQVRALQKDENLYDDNYKNNYDENQNVLCMPDRYLMYIFRKYYHVIYNVYTLSHLVNAITLFYTSSGNDEKDGVNADTNINVEYINEQKRTQNNNAHNDVSEGNQEVNTKVKCIKYTKERENYAHIYLLEIYTCRGRLLLTEPFFQSANCTLQEWQAELYLLRQFSNATYGAICQEHANELANVTPNKNKGSAVSSSSIHVLSSRDALYKVINPYMEILYEVEHTLQSVCLQWHHHKHYFAQSLSKANTNNKSSQSDISYKRVLPSNTYSKPSLLHRQQNKKEIEDDNVLMTTEENEKNRVVVETPHDVAQVLLLNILRSLYLTNQYDAVIQRFYQFQVKCNILDSYNTKNNIRAHTRDNNIASYLPWLQTRKKIIYLLTRQSTMHLMGRQNAIEYNQAIQYIIGWSSAALVIVAKAAMVTQNVDLMIELCHFHFTLSEQPPSYSLAYTHGMLEIEPDEEIFNLTIHAIQRTISQSMACNNKVMESKSKSNVAKAHRGKYIIIQQQIYDEFITCVLLSSASQEQQVGENVANQDNNVDNVKLHMNGRGNDCYNIFDRYKHSALLLSSPVHATLISIMKEANALDCKCKLLLGRSTSDNNNVNTSRSEKGKDKVQEYRNKIFIEQVRVMTRRLMTLLQEIRRPDGFVMLIVCDVMYKLLVLSKLTNESVMSIENKNSGIEQCNNSCQANTSLERQLILSLLLRHSSIFTWLKVSLSNVQCMNLFPTLPLFDLNQEEKWQWELNTLLLTKFIRICITEGMPYVALNLLQFAIHERYIASIDDDDTNKVTRKINLSISQLLCRRLSLTFSKHNKSVVNTITPTDKTAKEQIKELSWRYESQRIADNILHNEWFMQEIIKNYELFTWLETVNYLSNSFSMSEPETKLTAVETVSATKMRVIVVDSKEDNNKDDNISKQETCNNKNVLGVLTAVDIIEYWSTNNHTNRNLRSVAYKDDKQYMRSWHNVMQEMESVVDKLCTTKEKLSIDNDKCVIKVLLVELCRLLVLEKQEALQSSLSNTYTMHVEKLIERLLIHLWSVYSNDVHANTESPLWTSNNYVRYANNFKWMCQYISLLCDVPHVSITLINNLVNNVLSHAWSMLSNYIGSISNKLASNIVEEMHTYYVQTLLDALETASFTCTITATNTIGDDNEDSEGNSNRSAIKEREIYINIEYLSTAENIFDKLLLEYMSIRMSMQWPYSRLIHISDAHLTLLYLYALQSPEHLLRCLQKIAKLVESYHTCKLQAERVCEKLNKRSDERERFHKWTYYGKITLLKHFLSIMMKLNTHLCLITKPTNLEEIYKEITEMESIIKFTKDIIAEEVNVFTLSKLASSFPAEFAYDQEYSKVQQKINEVLWEQTELLFTKLINAHSTLESLSLVIKTSNDASTICKLSKVVEELLQVLHVNSFNLLQSTLRHETHTSHELLKNVRTYVLITVFTCKIAKHAELSSSNCLQNEEADISSSDSSTDDQRKVCGYEEKTISSFLFNQLQALQMVQEAHSMHATINDHTNDTNCASNATKLHKQTRKTMPHILHSIPYLYICVVDNLTQTFLKFLTLANCKKTEETESSPSVAIEEVHLWEQVKMLEWSDLCFVQNVAVAMFTQLLSENVHDEEGASVNKSIKGSTTHFNVNTVHVIITSTSLLPHLLVWSCTCDAFAYARASSCAVEEKNNNVSQANTRTFESIWALVTHNQEINNFTFILTQSFILTTLKSMQRTLEAFTVISHYNTSSVNQEKYRMTNMQTLLPKLMLQVADILIREFVSRKAKSMSSSLSSLNQSMATSKRITANQNAIKSSLESNNNNNDDYVTVRIIHLLVKLASYIWTKESKTRVVGTMQNGITNSDNHSENNNNTTLLNKLIDMMTMLLNNRKRTLLFEHVFISAATNPQHKLMLTPKEINLVNHVMHTIVWHYDSDNESEDVSSKYNGFDMRVNARKEMICCSSRPHNAKMQDTLEKQSINELQKVAVKWLLMVNGSLELSTESVYEDHSVLSHEKRQSNLAKCEFDSFMLLPIEQFINLHDKRFVSTLAPDDLSKTQYKNQEESLENKSVATCFYSTASQTPRIINVTLKYTNEYKLKIENMLRKTFNAHTAYSLLCSFFIYQEFSSQAEQNKYVQIKESNKIDNNSKNTIDVDKSPFMHDIELQCLFTIAKSRMTQEEHDKFMHVNTTRSPECRRWQVAQFVLQQWELLQEEKSNKNNNDQEEINNNCVTSQTNNITSNKRGCTAYQYCDVNVALENEENNRLYSDLWCNARLLMYFVKIVVEEQEALQQTNIKQQLCTKSIDLLMHYLQNQKENAHLDANALYKYTLERFVHENREKSDDNKITSSSSLWISHLNENVKSVLRSFLKEAITSTVTSMYNTKHCQRECANCNAEIESVSAVESSDRQTNISINKADTNNNISDNNRYSKTNTAALLNTLLLFIAQYLSPSHYNEVEQMESSHTNTISHLHLQTVRSSADDISMCKKDAKVYLIHLHSHFYERITHQLFTCLSTKYLQHCSYLECIDLYNFHKRLLQFTRFVEEHIEPLFHSFVTNIEQECIYSNTITECTVDTKHGSLSSQSTLESVAWLHPLTQLLEKMSVNIAILETAFGVHKSQYLRESKERSHFSNSNRNNNMMNDNKSKPNLQTCVAHNLASPAQPTSNSSQTTTAAASASSQQTMIKEQVNIEVSSLELTIKECEELFTRLHNFVSNSVRLVTPVIYSHIAISHNTYTRCMYISINTMKNENIRKNNSIDTCKSNNENNYVSTISQTNLNEFLECISHWSHCTVMCGMWSEVQWLAHSIIKLLKDSSLMTHRSKSVISDKQSSEPFYTYRKRQLRKNRESGTQSSNYTMHNMFHLTQEKLLYEEQEWSGFSVNVLCGLLLVLIASSLRSSNFCISESLSLINEMTTHLHEYIQSKEYVYQFKSSAEHSKHSNSTSWDKKRKVSDENHESNLTGVTNCITPELLRELVTHVHATLTSKVTLADQQLLDLLGRRPSYSERLCVTKPVLQILESVHQFGKSKQITEMLQPFTCLLGSMDEYKYCFTRTNLTDADTLAHTHVNYDKEKTIINDMEEPYSQQQKLNEKNESRENTLTSNNNSLQSAISLLQNASLEEWNSFVHYVRNKWKYKSCTQTFAENNSGNALNMFSCNIRDHKNLYYDDNRNRQKNEMMHNVLAMEQSWNVINEHVNRLSIQLPREHLEEGIMNENSVPMTSVGIVKDQHVQSNYSKGNDFTEPLTPLAIVQLLYSLPDLPHISELISLTLSELVIRKGITSWKEGLKFLVFSISTLQGERSETNSLQNRAEQETTEHNSNQKAKRHTIKVTIVQEYLLYLLLHRIRVDHDFAKEIVNFTYSLPTNSFLHQLYKRYYVEVANTESELENNLGAEKEQESWLEWEEPEGEKYSVRVDKQNNKSDTENMEKPSHGLYTLKQESALVAYCYLLLCKCKKIGSTGNNNASSQHNIYSHGNPVELPVVKMTQKFYCELLRHCVYDKLLTCIMYEIYWRQQYNRVEGVFVFASMLRAAKLHNDEKLALCTIAHFVHCNSAHVSSSLMTSLHNAVFVNCYDTTIDNNINKRTDNSETQIKNNKTNTKLYNRLWHINCSRYAHRQNFSTEACRVIWTGVVQLAQSGVLSSSSAHLMCRIFYELHKITEIDELLLTSCVSNTVKEYKSYKLLR